MLYIEHLTGLSVTVFAKKNLLCRSVARLSPTLGDPMGCSAPGFPVFHYLPEFALMSIKAVMPSNHLILCCPLLLLPSIIPIIRVFSNESALCIRWPNYWSFSFSISPSSEYSGLISLRIGWFDLKSHRFFFFCL